MTAHGLPTAPSLDTLAGPSESWNLITRAPGPEGALPLTPELLRHAPSGDLFGWTQDVGMGWKPAELNRPEYLLLSTAGGLPEGYMVNDFLTSAFAWFLLTNIDGLSYMERVKFETDMQVDFVTDNLLVKGYERYSFGYYNWRSIYGSFPTS